MTDKTPKIPDFVAKLYEILQNEENKDIIAWSQTEFVIKNTEALVKEVLPKYYRHSKLESFIRQLNLYGFRKVSKSSDKDLLEGAPQLLHKIQLKSKQKKIFGQSGIQDVKQLTKQRNEQLNNIRCAFKSTVQTIYQQIKHMGSANAGFQQQIKQSVLLLQLCGVRQENLPHQNQVFPQQSVTHFLTKFNLDF